MKRYGTKLRVERNNKHRCTLNSVSSFVHTLLSLLYVLLCTQIIYAFQICSISLTVMLLNIQLIHCELCTLLLIQQVKLLQSLYSPNTCFISLYVYYSFNTMFTVRLLAIFMYLYIRQNK